MTLLLTRISSELPVVYKVFFKSVTEKITVFNVLFVIMIRLLKLFKHSDLTYRSNDSLFSRIKISQSDTRIQMINKVVG